MNLLIANIMPHLLIEQDIPYDFSRFLIFLDPQKQDKSYQSRIFKKFPDLSFLEWKSKEEIYTELSIFLPKLYEENKKKIQLSLQEYRNSSEKLFGEALDTLVTIMEHAKPLPESYRAVVTFLPMYPFDPDRRTFCIPVFSDEPSRAIEVAIHEISHFFYFDWLEANGYEKFLQSKSWELYVAKEMITPILMRNDLLFEVFQKRFKANQNIELFQMTESESLVDYCERCFFTSSEDFSSFARKMTEFVIRNAEVLRERKSHGDQAYDTGVSEEEKWRLLEKMGVPMENS